MTIGNTASPARRRLWLAGTIAGAVALGVPLATYAQNAGNEAQADESNLGIEEITVTASKRGAQLLQHTPTTITALSEDMLDKLGVSDFEDFAYQVPGLTFNDTGPGERRYIIRGIASAGQQQVAVYYDEVPLPGVQDSSSDSGSQTTDLKIFDMQRIEVLKGPQGTTFGANSQSGTVRFITNKPNLTDFEGNVRAKGSETRFGSENWEVNAMVNVPFVEDKLAARVVVYSSRDSGFIDNVRLNLKNINEFRTTGIRGMLRMKPAENLTFDLMAWYQERDSDGDVRFQPFDTFKQRGDPTDIGFRDNVSLVAFFDTGDLKVGDFTKTGKPDNQQIYSGTINWELPFANVTATGSYYQRDFGFKFDSSFIILFLGSGPEGRLCGSNNDVPCRRPDLFPALTDQRQSLKQKHFEIRANSTWAGPLQGLIGFFYRDRASTFQSFVPTVNAAGETFDPGVPFTADPFATFPLPPGAGIPGCQPCVFARIADKSIKEKAVFGELTYNITDRLQALAGLRWFQVDQSDFGLLKFPFALFPPPVPQPNLQKAQQSKLIKKFELSWQVTDNKLLYVLAAQGFRLGGTNNQGIVDIPALFGADQLWNYELGAKTSWFDNRVVLNLATFFIQWKNLQVSAQDPTGAFGFVTNAGKAEVVGLEAEVFARPVQALDVTLGLSWLPRKQLTKDQVTTVDINGVAVTLFAPGKAGDEIPRIPEVTFNATGQYNFGIPALDGWDGYIRGEFSFKAKSRTELRPFEEGNQNDRPQRSFEIVNFRAGVHSDAFDGDIVIYALNVFDVRGDVFIGTGNGQPTNKITNRPRTIGVQLEKHF